MTRAIEQINPCGWAGHGANRDIDRLVLMKRPPQRHNPEEFPKNTRESVGCQRKLCEISNSSGMTDPDHRFSRFDPVLAFEPPPA